MGGVSELERIIRFLYDSVAQLKQASVITGQAGQVGQALVVAENFVFGGPGGNVIQAGRYGGLRWKGTGTILGWTLYGDANGSVVVDILKATYATYPTVASICGGTPPSISVAFKNQNLAPTGWATSLVDGDWLEFQVSSPTAFTELTLALDIVR